MKKILSLLLVGIMCMSLCACGNNPEESETEKKTEEVSSTIEEYVELKDDNEEIIKLGMTDIAEANEENPIQFEEKYLNKDVTIVGKITSINGATDYNGHIMDSYVELDGWLIETTGHEDIISELAVGDMVKVTGNIFMAFADQTYIYKVNDEVVTIEKILEK